MYVYGFWTERMKGRGHMRGGHLPSDLCSISRWTAACTCAIILECLVGICGQLTVDRPRIFHFPNSGEKGMLKIWCSFF